MASSLSNRYIMELKNNLAKISGAAWDGGEISRNNPSCVECLSR